MPSRSIALGRYSDAPLQACGEFRVMSRAAHELARAFKPPSLRVVAFRQPDMHAGQIKTLDEVVKQ